MQHSAAPQSDISSYLEKRRKMTPLTHGYNLNISVGFTVNNLRLENLFVLFHASVITFHTTIHVQEYTSTTIVQLVPKISLVCCCLYCYECTAWVTATNEWYILARYYELHNTNLLFIAHSDIVRITSNINMAFYKLHPATRFPHWLPYIRVSWI